MNINKHLILLFSVLFFLFAVSVSSGCFRKNESDVKSVVRNELDQLKNLDSETTQKYIPYTELFPDATENTDLTDEINKTFSLFFRKFNYKISDVIVGTANHSATVSVKLTTIDSKVLARDFKAELLRTQITESAQAQKGNIKDSSRSAIRPPTRSSSRELVRWIFHFSFLSLPVLTSCMLQSVSAVS